MQFSIILFGSQYKSNILYGRIGSNFFFKTDFKFYISMFLIPDSFCWNIENVESALSLLACSSVPANKHPVATLKWAVPKRCPMGASVTLQDSKIWRFFQVLLLQCDFSFQRWLSRVANVSDDTYSTLERLQAISLTFVVATSTKLYIIVVVKDNQHGVGRN